MNVGIEYDGVFWHSSEKAKKRETRKDAYCRDNNIRLIRIKESKECRQDADILYFDKRNESCQWLIDTLCDALSLPHIEVNVIEDTPAILDLMNKIRTETSLAIKRPDALEYWDYEKNTPITPDRIGYTSHHVLSWKCPKCGNEFRESVSAVTSRPNICKECGKKDMYLAVKRPDALAYWDYKDNTAISPNKIGYTSNQVVSWICPKCGDKFRESIRAVTCRKYICKECGK